MPSSATFGGAGLCSLNTDYALGADLCEVWCHSKLAGIDRVKTAFAGNADLESAM
jgi:hypothetical protein